MKKKTVFRVVLIVLCVLCTLSVLQIRNVLANHRQNERDDSTDDSFDEYSPHDLVLPPSFKDMFDLYGNTDMDEETNDIEEFLPRIPKTHDLFLRGPWNAYCELHLEEMHRETVAIIHSNIPNYLGIEYDESMRNSFRNSNEPIYSKYIVENSFEKYICEECNKIRDKYIGERIQ